MFDEYFKPPSAVSIIISAATLLPPDTTEATCSTSIDQDAPSLSTSPNNETTPFTINSMNVEEPNNEEEAEFDSDTFTNPFAPPETSLVESSSRTSAIALSCNSMQHSKTKHIADIYHFIKKQVENEIVELYFVKTAYQLVDIFTKALAKERFEFLVNCLGMQSIMPEELKHLVESDEDEDEI
uniref:Ribonuclease H n=1 Tax=Tanacetum cinerariifolium TaxID=118510 RepID=A0A699GMV8_TANCI|nr:ribonuclease H [Tanacetum cinerariifolium]